MSLNFSMPFDSFTVFAHVFLYLPKFVLGLLMQSYKTGACGSLSLVCVKMEVGEWMNILVLIFERFHNFSCAKQIKDSFSCNPTQMIILLVEI